MGFFIFGIKVVRLMPDEKRPRPQNANLRKYSELTDEQKAELASKGGVARQQQRRLQKLIQTALNVGVSQEALNEILVMAKMNPDKASNQQVKAGLAIALVNVDKALMGDNEARNWVMTHAFPDEYESHKQAPKNTAAPVAAQQQAPGADGSTGNRLNIHLIRGEKPRETEPENSPEPAPATPSGDGSEADDDASD